MSRFQCLMTRSSRLILALSSASRSASQKAYRDKREARTNPRKKKRFVRIGIVLTVRQDSRRSSWTHLQNCCLVFYRDHYPFNYGKSSAFLEFKSSLSGNKVEHHGIFQNQLKTSNPSMVKKARTTASA